MTPEINFEDSYFDNPKQPQHIEVPAFVGNYFELAPDLDLMPKKKQLQHLSICAK